MKQVWIYLWVCCGHWQFQCPALAQGNENGPLWPLQKYPADTGRLALQTKRYNTVSIYLVKHAIIHDTIFIEPRRRLIMVDPIVAPDLHLDLSVREWRARWWQPAQCIPTDTCSSSLLMKTTMGFLWNENLLQQTRYKTVCDSHVRATVTLANNLKTKSYMLYLLSVKKTLTLAHTNDCHLIP